VIYDEGLRSHKAIAFIATKRRNCVSHETTSYLKLGAPLQKTVLSKQTIRYLKLGANLKQIVLNNQETPRGFSKNLGEKIWIK